MKLNANKLRKSRLQRTVSKLLPRKKNDIYIILDNVLDTYNIGSVFRLADAVAAKKIYLCGGTETPPNHRIKKASINTMEIVEWEYCETAVDAIKKVRGLWDCHPEGEKRPKDLISESDSSLITQNDKGMARNDRKGMVIAVEQSKNSVPYDKFDYQLPIALVVGNESTGVSKEVLDFCDATVELPMFGVNISLNVMVSLGIVLYRIISDKNL